MENKGFILDNLGLNKTILKYLTAKYPNKSLHYAIQQELKAAALLSQA